jgi:hypothetical protein
MKKRSINSNLIIYNKFIFDAFEKNLQIDSIYTDFSKAFGFVDHKILISKQEIFSFSGNFLKWISSYLTGRTQIVKILNNLSITYCD